MSRTWQWVATRKSEVDTITCNVCDRVFKVGVDDDEMEEMISIVKTFGYHSKHFGDMTTINVDICEPCADKMFGYMDVAIFDYVAPWFYEIPPEEEGDLTIETDDATITVRR